MKRTWCVLAVLGLSSLGAFAQWTTQTIPLRPGWNAVYLEVQPEPRHCDSNFTNAPFISSPVESVWLWNRRFSPVQFLQNPNELVAAQPDWLTYVPLSHPASGVRNLFVLLGGRPYLIKLADNAAPVTWTVRGRPVARAPEWITDSFNYVGFSVTPSASPAFDAFFAGSPAHRDPTNRIYRLNTSGVWTLGSRAAAMTAGEAFWIRSSGQSSYPGPMSVSFEQGNALDYGRILNEQTLRIRNNSTSARTLIVKQLASQAPLAGPERPLAGSVPLSYWRMNLASNQVGWVPMPAQLTNLVPAGKEWALRLEVRRRDMLSPSSAESLYQSLLEVTDGAGSRQVVGVSAEGPQTAAPSQRGARAGAQRNALAAHPPEHPHKGLWVGYAAITNVSYPAASAGTELNPLATASEFSFRLLAHVDPNGQASLLQKVMIVWKNGQTNGEGVVTRDGRFVLFTDEKQASNPKYSGSRIVDGVPAGRRISSAAFAFQDPIPMSPANTFGTNSISCVVRIDHDDRLNPFKHLFHPDHNNLDEGYGLLPVTTNVVAGYSLTSTTESFTILRFITLQFTSYDPENRTAPGFGYSQLAGNYRETIYGLHHTAIVIEGVFRLARASNVGLLGDLDPD